MFSLITPARLSLRVPILFLFFFNATATTEIYTLSLHDALPISSARAKHLRVFRCAHPCPRAIAQGDDALHRHRTRSEEHTSELQSRQYLVCRLLLEKKKTMNMI